MMTNILNNTSWCIKSGKLGLSGLKNEYHFASPSQPTDVEHNVTPREYFKVKC